MLKRDPHCGHLFVFRGKCGGLIKVLWRDGQLIGLTSGHRDAAEQYRLYTEAVRRSSPSFLV